MTRGTGITTQQMISAPRNAVFVWLNSRLSYPKSLANKIGRGDLEIVPPSFLDSDRWHGRRFSAVVLDHAFTFTSRRQSAAYAEIQKLHITDAVRFSGAIATEGD